MKFSSEHIKSVIIVILVIAIFILGFAYYNEQKPMVEKSVDELKPPLPNDNISISLQKVSGIVLQYGSNHDDDIDKILIDANNNQLWLHFPPHTAKQVLNIAKIKSVISVEYEERPDKKNKIGYELKTVTADSKTLDISLIIPPLPSPGINITVTGSNVELKQDDNGQVTSFVLSGKMIAVPPHAANNLIPLLQTAKKITVKGNERGSNNGFVNMNGLSLVRPDEIKIDSINYLVR